MKAICEKVPNTILFLGPSGSGKDTQIDKIIDECGGENIGTGDMFRALYEEGTEEGKEAHDYWVNGIWVPDDLVYKLFSRWLEKFDSSQKWFLSQVVRTTPQVPLLDDLLGKFGRKLDLVIHFALSKEKAIERMSLRRVCPKCEKEYHLECNKPSVEGKCDVCGVDLVTRSDDQPAAIAQRIEEYENKVRPVLDIYKERGILVELDAGPSIDEIHNEVMEIFK